MPFPRHRENGRAFVVRRMTVEDIARTEEQFKADILAKDTAAWFN